MRSALTTEKLSVPFDFTKKGYYFNPYGGLPAADGNFLLPFFTPKIEAVTGQVTLFTLVNNRTFEAYPLNQVHIQSENGVYYYNGDVDLLTSLKDQPQCDIYYMYITIDSLISYRTEVFYLDRLGVQPGILGDFNTLDHNDDFYKD